MLLTHTVFGLVVSNVDVSTFEMVEVYFWSARVWWWWCVGFKQQPLSTEDCDLNQILPR